RVDVVAAAGEEADHPRQHARLVIHQHRQGVGLDLLGDRRGGIVGGVHATSPVCGGGCRRPPSPCPPPVSPPPRPPPPPPAATPSSPRPARLTARQPPR